MAIQLLVADNQKFLIESIHSYIKNHVHDIQVAGVSQTYEDLLQTFSLSHPDVALLDRYLGKVDILRCYKDLRKLSPSSKLIIFTGFPHPDDAKQAIALGFSAYVDKGNSLEVILTCVRKVYTGETCIVILKGFDTPPLAKELVLTPEQKKILCLKAKGLKGREIAMACGRGEAWLYGQLGELKMRFDVEDADSLVKIALEQGICRDL